MGSDFFGEQAIAAKQIAANKVFEILFMEMV
jgi:hypothetical protein